MTSKELLANALERIADRLDTLDAMREDVHAIRLKLDMVTDDHDEALKRLNARLRALEAPSNGKASDAG